MMSFNSPVWFNLGIEEHPQFGVFHQQRPDSMTSILDLAKTEGMLFKFGSGTGSNLSTLRSSREQLSGGVRPRDRFLHARVRCLRRRHQSGGKTRRAAKMVILNADHPDIMEFIDSKAREERKARALIDAGYDAAFNAQAGPTIRSSSRTPTTRCVSRTSS